MPYAGDKWEYKCKKFKLGYTPNELEEELNTQGNLGWYLVMFFKRRDQMLMTFCRKKLA